MPPATLADLRLDEATWGEASPERRHEWRLAINEILQEGCFELPQSAPEPLHALLTLKKGRGRFEVRTAGGAEVVRHDLPLERIAQLADEYMKTIGEMNKLGVSTHSPRLEALDIAKRITHDEAGEELLQLLPVLRPDHATARRLFTLFVILLHDTTRLAARPHSFHY